MQAAGRWQLLKTYLLPAHRRMLTELGVILQWEVEAIMRSSALFTGHSRTRNQQSGLQDVRGFAGAAIAARWGSQGAQLRDDLPQAFSVAHHAHVLPHERLYFLDELLRLIRLTIAVRGRRPWRASHRHVLVFRMQMIAHVLRRARPINQPFEQRIAGQPAGAVHTSTSDFSRGEESRDGGLTSKIGAHTAHRIVRRGTDGHQFGGDIDVVPHTRGVNHGETLAHAIAVKMRQVEIYSSIGTV